jgi:hypothetical protein
MKVGKKRVIVTVETFRDLMLTANDPKDKKSKVINLLKNEFEKTLDSKYGFEFGSLNQFLRTDFDFFLTVYEIIRDRQCLDKLALMRWHVFSHRKKILDKFKASSQLEKAAEMFKHALLHGK